MTVHVVGAGMAGLSAAFTLTRAGVPVVVHESAARAGGRCCSFFDKRLNAVIDAGTHLMLGANTALLAMLAECPTRTPLKNAGTKMLFFRKDGTRFEIDTARPLSAAAHLPELYPLLCESVMNTPARQADAAMFLKTAAKCFGAKNGAVYLADPSLRDSVVAPVEQYLKQRGVAFRFGRRLRRVRENRLIFFDGEEIELSGGDKAVLAVSPDSLSRLIVGAPEFPHQTIVNLHYKTDAAMPAPFFGMTGMTGHWVFAKNGIVSVTISAANDLTARYSPDALAGLAWRDLARILKTNEAAPPFRAVLEKRATILQTRAVNRSRLNQDIGSGTVFIAGDATATALPCTIEGAVRSGIAAARAALN